MAFWLDIAAFLLKAIIIVAAMGGLALLIARLARSGEPKDQEIKVSSLDERYDDMRDAMNGALLNKKERKALANSRKKEAKAEAKARPRPGAGQTHLRARLQGRHARKRGQTPRGGDRRRPHRRPAGNRRSRDQIESPGGTVTGYGLAAAEILRLRHRKIAVTASVDQVAASGGYMMACAADRIVAAPFAVVGSIGVVAPVPNLHRLLQEERDRFRGNDGGRVQAHRLGPGRDHAGGARAFPRQARRDARGFQGPCRRNAARRWTSPSVANGDYWLAREAMRLGLVDEIMTGDELLFRAREERAPLRSLDGSAQDPAAANHRRNWRARFGGRRILP